MNKNGFTLIEIIVCIVLLSVIGTGFTYTVISVNNKNENNILEDNSQDFTNALNIYLATHSEVLSSLNNHVEGAIVSLDLLKNEGLINDNLNIDYKNNYFLLSDAVLVSDVKDGNSACDGRISISTIKSWELDTYNTSDVIYICPKNGINQNSSNTNVISNGYIAKGENPNNWVKFEVKTNNDNWVWFEDSSDKDLWRILSINEDGNIRLIYNDYVRVNQKNNPFIDYTSVETECGKDYFQYCRQETCSSSRLYVKFSSYDNVDFDDVLTLSIGNDFKKRIYDSIKNNSWIKKEKYYYESPWESFDGDTILFSIYSRTVNKNVFYEDYIGNLNVLDLRVSHNEFDETYIEPQLLGVVSSNSNYHHYFEKGYGEDEYIEETGTFFYKKGNTWYDCYDKHISILHDGREYYVYYPVITLDSSVSIKSFDNCSDGNVRGSKECPFELENKSI